MHKLFLLFLLVFPLLFTSCDDNDGYSLDKFWVSMATVENPNNSHSFYLRLDNGDKLWTAATSLHSYRPKTGQRILADYTILSDRPDSVGYKHDVKLNNAYNILTKSVFDITPATQDSIGNDPIGIRDMWIGGGFLNVRFYFEANNKRHFINLVRDSSNVYDDDSIHLEFRHNAYNDEKKYRAGGWASFDLKPLLADLPTQTEKVNFTIHVKGLDGNDKTHELVFDPSTQAVSPKGYSREEYNEGQDVPVE